MTRTRLTAAALFLLLLALAAPAAHAQDSLRRELRDSQQRLEQIRREREQLQEELARLRSRVHDVSSELRNIEQQVTISAGVLRELEFQSAALGGNIENTTRELLVTRDRLRERTVVLQQRLRSIYKSGPLHAVRVLLSAESFGDLLNRYKYLHLITLHDRVLLTEIGRLEQRLVHQEEELQGNLAALERLRAEKLDEVTQLEFLQRQQQRTLSGFRQRERQTEGQIEKLARDEARLTGLIADLERRRREEERRRISAGGGPAGEGTLTTRDLGALDWPVEGELLYRFGPERRPNGVVLRWNGIGIAAQAGAPVQAVQAGTVMLAGPLEGYGPSVVLHHGGGYYTLYLHLRNVAVREGQQIRAGQTVGTVGGERTPEGPHIEFQVRAPVRGGATEAVDPLDWLRSRAAR